VVTLEQMVTALLAAVENPAHGIKVVRLAGDSRGEGLKSRANRGVQGHSTPVVTFHTEVMA
jgi:hypothetical protein